MQTNKRPLDEDEFQQDNIRPRTQSKAIELLKPFVYFKTSSWYLIDGTTLDIMDAIELLVPAFTPRESHTILEDIDVQFALKPKLFTTVVQEDVIQEFSSSNSSSPHLPIGSLLIKDSTVNDASVIKLSSTTMKDLNIINGSYILVKANHGLETVCIVIEERDFDLNCIRMNTVLMKNINVVLGDYVTISPFDDIPNCDKILILPIEDGNVTRQIIRKDSYRPMKMGDSFIDLASKDKPEYIIMYMSPCKYGIIGPSTAIYYNLDEFNLSIIPESFDKSMRKRGEREDDEKIDVEIVVPSGPNKGVQNLSVEVPFDYPFRPPKFQFTSIVKHPCVNDKGVICLFDCDWGPIMRLAHLLLHIVSILIDPKHYDKGSKSIAMPSIAEFNTLEDLEQDFSNSNCNNDYQFEDFDDEQPRVTHGGKRNIIVEDESTEDESTEDESTENDFYIGEVVTARFNGEWYDNATILTLVPDVAVEWEDLQTSMQMSVNDVRKMPSAQQHPTYFHPKFKAGEVVKAVPLGKKRAYYATICRIEENGTSVMVRWRGGEIMGGLPIQRLVKINDTGDNVDDKVNYDGVDDDEDEEEDDEGLHFRINAQHAEAEDNHNTGRHVSTNGKTSFRRYIMHIVYGLTDPDFLSKVRQGSFERMNGHSYREYADVIRKIEGHFNLLFDSILSSGGWNQETVDVVKSFPTMVVSYDQVRHSKCQACNKNRCGLKLKNQLAMSNGNGNLKYMWLTEWNRFINHDILCYDRVNERQGPPSASLYMTNYCTIRMKLYHQCFHYKYHLVKRAKAMINSADYGDDALDAFVTKEYGIYRRLITIIEDAGKRYSTSREQFEDEAVF